MHADTKRLKKQNKTKQTNKKKLNVRQKRLPCKISTFRSAPLERFTAKLIHSILALYRAKVVNLSETGQTKQTHTK